MTHVEAVREVEGALLGRVRVRVRVGVGVGVGVGVRVRVRGRVRVRVPVRRPTAGWGACAGRSA